MKYIVALGVTLLLVAMFVYTPAEVQQAEAYQKRVSAEITREAGAVAIQATLTALPIAIEVEREAARQSVMTNAVAGAWTRNAIALLVSFMLLFIFALVVMAVAFARSMSGIIIRRAANYYDMGAFVIIRDTNRALDKMTGRVFDLSGASTDPLRAAISARTEEARIAHGALVAIAKATKDGRVADNIGVVSASVPTLLTGAMVDDTTEPGR